MVISIHGIRGPAVQHHVVVESSLVIVDTPVWLRWMSNQQAAMLTQVHGVVGEHGRHVLYHVVAVKLTGSDYIHVLEINKFKK